VVFRETSVVFSKARMQSLELKFLGELEVRRSGSPQPLPPSRKTRALLAYLALNDRSFRREHLCELLWEVPDDPRGSLRWSLSKLRRLVDDAGCPRIVADRTHVRFEAGDIDIDVKALRTLVAGDLGVTPLDVLEGAAAQFSGHFLEGLELSNFHDFHAWCVAEREQNSQAQAALLGALAERLQRTPERALPYARSLVSIAPYDENARAQLIGLLVALGRTDEAEQQHRLGSHLLREAGVPPTGTLTRALRGSAPPPAPPRIETPIRALHAEPKGDRVVGRADELTEIAQAFDRATRERRAQMLLIRGDPGMGKSRLLQVAAELARNAGATLLEAGAYESESIRPFAIWVDALRRHAPDTERSVFEGNEGHNRERLFASLSDCVAGIAKSTPIALLFDDIQWCDESSAAALHYVARTNREAPFVGVLAARDDELNDNAAMQQTLQGLRHAGLLREIRLAPLSSAEARELIAECAPDADCVQIARQCGGNPLIAIEFARADLSGDSGASLAELVRERLARLGIESGEVLRWASVLAPRIDVSMLERASGLDSGPIGLALEAAARQSILLADDDGIRFSHDLVARSVYSDVSPARRRLMHRRVAELLEKEAAIDLEHAADLAHHAAQSGDAGIAARAMVSAGRLCLRFFANEEALSLARRGLKFVEKLGDAERVCLTLDLRDIMMTAAPLDDWEAAADEYVSLAERALDHGALSHARRGYYMASHVRWMHGQWAGAHDQILQAERVSRGASDEDHIVGMAEAARCLALLERDLTHADAMLMEAQALAARKRVVHYSIPAALGMLRYHQNELDEAVEHFQEARTLAKSAGDRISEFQANEYLVMIDIERGRFDAARARCATLLEIGTKLREGSEAPFARALELVCDYAQGGEDDDLGAAFEALRVVDAKHRLAYVLTRAAMVDVERGRYDRALALAGEALEHARALERATDMMLAEVVLAEAHQARGDEAAFAGHAAALGEFDPGRVAEWVRLRAARLLPASD
jgi:DNA-binding SARP family transcriptional activator